MSINMTMKPLNSQGFSLVELMMSSGISMLIGLGLLATLNFAVERLNLVTEQVKAEESLALAALQLSKYLSQAVKIRCCRGANCMVPGGVLSAIPHPTFNQVNIGGEPLGIADGVIDCRAGSVNGHVGGRQNAIALFTREAGTASPIGSAVSSYRGSAIYFVSPLADARTGSANMGDNSGRLEFLSVEPAAAGFQRSSFFERLVSVGVNEGFVGAVPDGVAQFDDATAQGYLRSISLRLTARYFESSGRGIYHYRVPGPVTPHRDIATVITVLFRNNRIGVSALNGITSERPLGQIYFFRNLNPAFGGRE